jgi:aminoglycoside phosphotransferase (APT) family kinase protein
MVAEVLIMAEGGATDMEIADSLDVSVRTLYRWKAQHPDFRQALKIAKDVADERVERSLYQRATGYEQDAVKIFMPAGAANPVMAPYRELIAPDTTACIFWLKNRKSQEWRDKTDVTHGGDPDNPIAFVVKSILEEE